MQVSIFGNTYNLRLKRNHHLLARNLTYTVVDGPMTKGCRKKDFKN
jgi:hypothetical protein